MASSPNTLRGALLSKRAGSMSRIVILIFAVIALVYLGLCVFLFLSQRSLLYFPPARSLANNAPTISFPVDGAELLITVRARSGPKALIYFGGNGEDVSYGLPALTTAFPERALYLMNYRGYGGSSGKPSEAAIVADALAFFDKAHAEHSDIILMGRSLGSGVAIQLAAQRPASHLVLVTPYNSIQELAARRYPFFPVRWLLLDKFESWKYAPRIAIPTLVIAAEHDYTVPGWSTELLLTHFQSGIATLRTLPGTGHNNLSESAEYIALLKNLR
jgi:pimeloyl-ACP methyl ester carboxylesterase